MAYRIYDASLDDFRDATQEDIDRMYRRLVVLGAFFTNLERMVKVAREGIKTICEEEKQDA